MRVAKLSDGEIIGLEHVMDRPIEGVIDHVFCLAIGGLFLLLGLGGGAKQGIGADAAWSALYIAGMGGVILALYLLVLLFWCREKLGEEDLATVREWSRRLERIGVEVPEFPRPIESLRNVDLFLWCRATTKCLNNKLTAAE